MSEQIIPDNAQHITWGSRATAYSRRGQGWVGGTHAGVISEEDLIETWIAGAKVIVLEESE